MNKYRCNRCGKIVERKSRKAWMKSYCLITRCAARIYRVKEVKRMKKKKKKGCGCR